MLDNFSEKILRFITDNNCVKFQDIRDLFKPDFEYRVFVTLEYLISEGLIRTNKTISSRSDILTAEYFEATPKAHAYFRAQALDNRKYLITTVISLLALARAFLPDIVNLINRIVSLLK